MVGRSVSGAGAYQGRPASPAYTLEDHDDHHNYSHDQADEPSYDQSYSSYPSHQDTVYRAYSPHPLPQPPADSHAHMVPVPPLPSQDTSYPASYSDNPFEHEQDYPPSSYPPSGAERGHQNPFASTSTLGATSGAAGGAAFARMDNGYLHAERPGLDRPLSTEYSNYPSSRDGHRNAEHSFGTIDPMDLADDDDDPWSTTRKAKKGFFGGGGGAAAAAGGGVGAGAAAAGLSKTARDASGNYNPVPASYDTEKSAYLAREASRMKRRKFIVFGSIGLIILLAIAGGVIGVVLTLRNKAGSSANAADDNGGQPLTKDSPQIQALLNNKDLHQVFPGIDYTPLNAQYPDCLQNPPTQNNITKDIAVISQLAPQIRLYGTDCNQTAMVYQAMQTLGLTHSMKLWLGVWQDGNASTNARQLAELYSAMDLPGMKDVVAGIFVGNEVLFSKYMSEAQLLAVIASVRANATAKGYAVPVGTSDLGSNWTPSYAAGVDFLGANIHPFFAGVAVDLAATWTYQFWQSNDVKLTAGTSKKQIISEVGWPSQGGNDCTDGQGNNVPCANAAAGSVAGVDQLNRFMGDFVCQSLANGTQYFW